MAPDTITPRKFSSFLKISVTTALENVQGVLSPVREDDAILLMRIILVMPLSIQVWKTTNSLALKSSALLSVDAMPSFVLWVPVSYTHLTLPTN